MQLVHLFDIFEPAVDDIVSGIVLALETKTASRQTYILSGDSMPYSDIISTVNQACGRAPPLFTIPLPVAKILMALLAPVLRIRTCTPLNATSHAHLSHNWI